MECSIQERRSDISDGLIVVGASLPAFAPDRLKPTPKFKPCELQSAPGIIRLHEEFWYETLNCSKRVCINWYDEGNALSQLQYFAVDRTTYAGMYASADDENEQDFKRGVKLFRKLASDGAAMEYAEYYLPCPRIASMEPDDVFPGFLNLMYDVVTHHSEDIEFSSVESEIRISDTETAIDVEPLISIAAVSHGENVFSVAAKTIEKLERNRTRQKTEGKPAQTVVLPAGRSTEAEETQDSNVHPPVSEHDYEYCESGANFKVRFDGESGDIPAALRGANYIRLLLQSPGEAFPAINLSCGVDADESNATNDREDNKEALQAYKESYADIEMQLVEARQNDDIAMIERLEDGKQEIGHEVKKLTGFGGVTYANSGGPAGNARSSVQQAIKLVIDKCRKDYNMPRFAAHLEVMIDTGKDVIYRPASPAPDWNF